MKYVEIELYIIGMIKKEMIKPYEKIPTEQELIIKFETSKMTVRKAITSLAAQGIIFTVKGSGNYVSPLNEYDAMTDFTDPVPGTVVKYFNSTTVIQEKTLDKLQLSEENKRPDKWFPFVQLFSENGEVVGYSINWIFSNTSIHSDTVGGQPFKDLLDQKFSETNKQITDMKFEKTTDRDRSFLQRETDYTAQKVIYNFNQKHEPTYISIIKTTPEYFSEKSVKSFKK